MSSIHLPPWLLASFTGILHLDHFDAGSDSACSIYNSYVVITDDLNSPRGRWFSRHCEVHWPHPSIRFGSRRDAANTPFGRLAGCSHHHHSRSQDGATFPLRRGMKWNFTMPYLHVQSVCGKGYEGRGRGTIWTKWTLWAEIVWNDHLVEGTVTPSVKPSSSHPVVVKLCPDRDCHSNAIYASFSVFLVIQFHSVLNTAAWLIGRIPKFGHFYMYLQTGCFMLHLIVGMQAFHCHLSLAMDLCSAAQGLLVVPPSHAFAMQLHCGWMQPASFLPVLCIFFQWLQTILFECGHALSGQKGFSSRGAT